MKASISLALSLIHNIVAHLKFKRLNASLGIDGKKSEVKATTVSFGSKQPAGSDLFRRRRLPHGYRKIALRLLLGLLVVPIVVLWSNERQARVDTSQGTIQTGAGPQAIAVNPATNKIYVANDSSATVTVIDGSNNTTATVVVGSHPIAIAVNPVTNKIYVANNGSSNVTVIDGSTNTTTNVTVGTNPSAVAINPVTNKIYVANANSGNVTVINGSNNSTTPVATVAFPGTVAVNPVTNKIYVGNSSGGGVTVIDGSDNTTTPITLSAFSILSIAVNPLTNKIYVAFQSTTTELVEVIDGSNNTTGDPFPLGPGNPAAAIVVNPVTNKIYCTIPSSDSVAVINGGDDSWMPVTTGDSPVALAVNPVTNKIYVANLAGNTTTVINGADNTTTTVAAGTNPSAVAVNPITNRIYVANMTSNNVTVIDGSENNTATLTGVASPAAIAVNSNTNKIYVVNQIPVTGSVTVINGNDNTTAIIPVGPFPQAIAINSVTNKIYVANNNSSVTVIDGNNNSTASVATGGACRDIAVNPSTNKIYVATAGSTATVINGVNNSTASVAVGANSQAVAVNSVTNKIYIANIGGSVTVINGSDNTTATVTTGTGSVDIDINSNTNKIYVANQGGNTVTVINGSDNTTATVTVGTGPMNLAVNSVTNKIYVANQTSNNVTVINGSDNTTTTVTAGTSPRGVAVNSVSNKTYVANNNSNNVTVIDGSDNSTTTVNAGTGARAVGINSVTGKIYVGNFTANNITVINGSDNTTATIADGILPRAIAVNPVTNKIYVANSTNSVAVIDGNNNTMPPFAVGTSPIAMALNPVTNKIYVANQSSNNVTVINGSDNTTSTVPAGTSPIDIVVNPVTNKIYVANNGSGNVTVINGNDNSTATVVVGDSPQALAINPATNRIYVANAGISNNVTVINGADNTTVTVAAGTLPKAVAVNPITNKIYVANQTSANVTVINGVNNTATTVGVGTSPRAVAVNTITNKIYVANNGSANVTVIDGSDNSTATVTAGTAPQAIAVNPVNNRIYVTNSSSGNVTVIDGINNITNTIAALTGPNFVAINPVTNKIYVGSISIGGMTVITPVATQTIPLTVSIAPLANDSTVSLTPTFNFTATSAFTPVAPPVNQIYYQVDTWTGPWLKASPGGGIASGQTPAIQPGAHIIYAFAGDGQEATSINSTPNSSPLIGQISAYLFDVVLPTTVRVNSFPNPSLAGQPVSLLASVIASDTTPLNGGTVQFKDGGNNIGSPVGVINGAAALSIDSFSVGAHTITADYSGVTAVFNATSSNSVIQNVTTIATWTGATSSDWNTATNWSTNFAPTSLTNVTIPATGVTNEPTITAANINVNDLTVAIGRTLTISANRTLTINGTANVSGTIAGAGALLQTGPTFTNNGQISVATALFGGASQSVNGSGVFAGNNTFIVLSGTSVTLGNNFSLVNVYVSSGGSLNLSSFAITLSGAGTALQADGSLTTTGSTIVYNGATAQSTAPANVIYNNLTIANSAGVTLSANTTVNGELSLTSGDLNTGAFTLTMPATATSSGNGDVIGAVKRTGFTVGSALSCGNPFNTIRFDTGTPPVEVTVNLDKNVPATPAPFPQAIARKYTITPSGGSGYAATLRLHYQDGDLNGNLEGMNLRLWRYDGANWVNVGQSAFDTTANWVEMNGVTQFSPWTMNSTLPTAAELESLIATGYDRGVLIEWRTGFEVNNLGFNLYRDEEGKRSRVNPDLVAGSALLAGGNTVLRAGRGYSFWDTTASNKSATSYWLEDVDLNGQSSWHGPYYSKVSTGIGPVRRNSPFIGQNTPAQSGVSRPVERAAALQTMKPDQVASQAALVRQGAVKLWVNREGWYRVTAPELAQAGLDPKANVTSLQLYADGQQVPINVIKDKQGLLAAVEFYGRGIDAAFTDQRVYWLISGAQPGLRIPQMKANGYSATASSFLSTVERKDRTIYFAALRNGDRENFFGSVLATQPVDQTITLGHVDESAGGAATLEVALQGVTLQQHRTWVYLNGVFTGELFFNRQAEGVASFSVPQSLLRSGDNDVKLVTQGGPSDISLVDYIRVSYWHSFTADDDALRFTATGNQAVTVFGFNSGEIRVLDVTNPDSIQEIAASIQPQKSGYAVTATPAGAGERRLLAITDEQAMKPCRIAADQVSNWRSSTNAADLVIISRRDWASSLQPLVALRESQGLKVALVDIEDVYDEFSFGNKSPGAVKDFLAYVKTNWKKKPGYLLLVGDASYDAKNYLGLGDQDVVPTKLLDTQLLEVASDDWLADFDGDGIADLAIGRLPARSNEEVIVMVRKIIDYERSQGSRSMLLVSDKNEGFDFEAAASRLRSLIPDGLRVVQINRGQMDAAEARKQLLDATAQGQKIINYTGHGSASQWHDSLLTSEDVGSLTNRDRLPVFVMMTCLNGFFDDPSFDSLAESLVKAENGGAVAVWASSGVTLPDGQSQMNQQLYRLLFGINGQSMRLGDAMKKAKSSISDGDIRRTWVLLGDPTMRLR